MREIGVSKVDLLDWISDGTISDDATIDEIILQGERIVFKISNTDERE